MKIARFYMIILLGIILNSCDKDKSVVDPYVDAKAYCPLHIGDYIIYQVIDTALSLGSVVEPNSFQLKIRVREKIGDPSVLEKYTLERYKRNNDGSTWELDSMWFVSYTNGKELVFYEENIPYVKLVSPLKSGISWNGNKYNVGSAESYKTRSFEKPYFVSDTIFANTVKIIQNEDFENAIGYTNKYEVYAKDMGLVYKLYRSYRYGQDNSNIDRTVRIGFIREMKYLSHGKD